VNFDVLFLRSLPGLHRNTVLWHVLVGASVYIHLHTYIYYLGYTRGTRVFALISGDVPIKIGNFLMGVVKFNSHIVLGILLRNSQIPMRNTPTDMQSSGTAVNLYDQRVFEVAEHHIYGN